MSTTLSTRAVVAPDPGRRKRRVATMSRSEAWRRRAPLLPALVHLVLTTQLPFAVAIVVSLLHWNALYPDRRGFAGLDNYVRVFTEDELRSAVLVTIVLTVSVVAVSLVLGLLIALLLNQKFFGRGVVRTLMIVPFLVVPVAAALLWKHTIFNPEYGLLNGTLRWAWGLFGAAGQAPQVDWISSMPLLSIVASLVWQWTPFMMLIILAGLQSRPADAIEAAQLDGAGAVSIFWHITLPHLRRYIEIGTILGAVFIVQNFDHVFTMTSGGLGTANLPYTIYQTFFQRQDYGLAAAMGVVVVAGTLVLAMFGLRSVSSMRKDS